MNLSHPQKINIGFLRLHIDTVQNHFMYEESDRLEAFHAVYLCGKIRRKDRPIDVHREPVHSLRHGRIKVPFFSQKGNYQFLELIKRRDIRLFYAELIYDAIPFLLIAKKTSLPLVINFRGGDFAMPLVRLFIKEVLSLTKTVITKSSFQKSFLIDRGIPANKIRVMYGGINLGNIPFRSRRIDKKNLRFISVGRSIEKKGFETTLSFFDVFTRECPQARLTLICEGEDRGIFNRYLDLPRLRSKINIMPYMPHDAFMKELYAHDIFILPSVRTSSDDMEGIPNVLKEAMASGMPVISTFHSGIPELVTDGATGFLVKEKDSIDIARKVEYILKNPEKIGIICSKARIRIEKVFNLEKTTKSLENLFVRILQKK